MRRRSVLAGLAATAIGTGPRAHRLFAEETAPGIGSEIRFVLVDTDGKTVRGTDLRGRWLLVFFGYTHCPDLCPTASSEIAGALEQLGNLAERVQPVFVSIDPERDTPTALREYVQGFDARMLALTGTVDQLAQSARSFGVAFYKVPGSTPDEYTYAHSSTLTLIGPEGGLVSRFSTDVAAEGIATTLRKLIHGGSS